MEKIIEILKIILPALITGIFTFIVTKYNYNKNVPLDKMELAYNRVYYPIYQIVHNKYKTNIQNLDSVIAQISFYLRKSSKYVDKSTLNAFNLLCEYKDKYSYKNFADNIYDKSSYLRRRLGYLEPNILESYKYMSKQEKSTLRINIEILIICILGIIVNIVPDSIGIIVVAVVIIFIIIAFVEFVVKVINFLRLKIKQKKRWELFKKEIY